MDIAICIICVIMGFLSLSNYKFQSAVTLFKELLQDSTAKHSALHEYIG